MSLFYRIFDQLYEKVDKEYYPIIFFVLDSREEDKITKYFRHYTQEEVKKGKKLDIRMYYCKNDDPFYINFLAFDDKGVYLEITSEMIEKKKDKCPE